MKNKQNNLHRQRGVSAPGWMIIVAIFGFLLITFFKIFPMFYENLRLETALNAVVQNTTIDTKSKKSIWQSLQKNMFIQEVRSVKRENVDISRKDSVTTITIVYETRDDFVGNLTIGAKFRETVTLER